jgi:hypothetical protein
MESLQHAKRFLSSVIILAGVITSLAAFGCKANRRYVDLTLTNQTTNDIEVFFTANEKQTPHRFVSLVRDGQATYGFYPLPVDASSIRIYWRKMDMPETLSNVVVSMPKQKVATSAVKDPPDLILQFSAHEWKCLTETSPKNSNTSNR